MGEYEPRDSRKVTLKQARAPGEPPRTGPREGETRRPPAPPSGRARTELDDDGRGERIDEAIAQVEAQRGRTVDQEAEALDARRPEGPERFDRND